MTSNNTVGGGAIKVKQYIPPPSYGQRTNNTFHGQKQNTGSFNATNAKPVDLNNQTNLSKFAKVSKVSFAEKDEVIDPTNDEQAGSVRLKSPEKTVLGPKPGAGGPPKANLPASLNLKEQAPQTNLNLIR